MRKNTNQNNVEEKVENLVMEKTSPPVHKRWITGSKGDEYELTKYFDGSYTCTCPAYEHGKRRRV